LGACYFVRVGDAQCIVRSCLLTTWEIEMKNISNTSLVLALLFASSVASAQWPSSPEAATCSGKALVEQGVAPVVMTCPNSAPVTKAKAPKKKGAAKKAYMASSPPPPQSCPACPEQKCAEAPVCPPPEVITETEVVTEVKTVIVRVPTPMEPDSYGLRLVFGYNTFVEVPESRYGWFQGLSFGFQKTATCNDTYCDRLFGTLGTGLGADGGPNSIGPLQALSLQLGVDRMSTVHEWAGINFGAQAAHIGMKDLNSRSFFGITTGLTFEPKLGANSWLIVRLGPTLGVSHDGLYVGGYSTAAIAMDVL
jgi:hypothetical protein